MTTPEDDDIHTILKNIQDELKSQKQYLVNEFRRRSEHLEQTETRLRNCMTHQHNIAIANAQKTHAVVETATQEIFDEIRHHKNKMEDTVSGFESRLEEFEEERNSLTF